MKIKDYKIFIRIVVLLILVSVIAMPSIRFKINQSSNREFIEKAREYASSNVMIVQENYKKGENTSANSYTAGSSGSIFKKEGNKYFALTAYHVIKDRKNSDSTGIIVIRHDDLDFKEYLNSGGKFQGISNYYQQLPKAEIEYLNEKYDLAVISFYSDKDYKVLSISDTSPEHGDVVATISNPERKRNSITAGKIISRNPKPFGDEDGRMQHPVIRHTALISEGSSGSGLLNENLEIVGINLGGKENLLGQYISGMAMPSDRIIDFLEEWKR